MTMHDSTNAAASQPRNRKGQSRNGEPQQEIQYWCRVLGVELGPMPASDVINLIKEGQLDANDRIRTQPDGAWARLRSLKEFRTHLPAAPKEPEPAAVIASQAASPEPEPALTASVISPARDPAPSPTHATLTRGTQTSENKRTTQWAAAAGVIIVLVAVVVWQLKDKTPAGATSGSPPQPNQTASGNETAAPGWNGPTISVRHENNTGGTGTAGVAPAGGGNSPSVQTGYRTAPRGTGTQRRLPGYATQRSSNNNLAPYPEGTHTGDSR